MTRTNRLYSCCKVLSTPVRSRNDYVRRLYGTAAAAMAKGSPNQPAANHKIDNISIANVRNFGISAHVDSGKTTMTERILYYTGLTVGRIDKIHEVATEVGATMDHMELEREKGITIQSAATHAKWDCSGQRYHFNIIDTPGHIDFQIEVERSLRVLDGAIFVVCGAHGVQSQSYTVDRQMRRYNVPRFVFINKLDRQAANGWAAMESVKTKLNLPILPLQVPMGKGAAFEGIVDVIENVAVRYAGASGEFREVQPDIPASFREQAKDVRAEMIETLANLDDDFAAQYLDEDITVPNIRAAIRRLTIARQLVPCLFGSAKRNKGVQEALNAVCWYLPHAAEPTADAFEIDSTRRVTSEIQSKPIQLRVSDHGPLVLFAFKIQELPGVGVLTYVKIYSVSVQPGLLRRGVNLQNPLTGKRVIWKKMYRMHSKDIQEETEARAGDIVALTGLDVNTGTTLTQDGCAIYMQGLEVPETVISAAVRVDGTSNVAQFTKSCKRFEREDPTFKLTVDPESKEYLVHGMGELQLEIYRERIKREYGVEIKLEPPKVNLREAITKKVAISHVYKRQHGGRGEWAKIEGYFEPIDPELRTLPPCEFVNDQFGSGIPPQFVTSLRKSFQAAMLEGRLTGSPVVNTRFVLNDGATHEADSNDMAFRNCFRTAWEKYYAELNPVALEPIVKVEITVPNDVRQTALPGIAARGVEVEEEIQDEESTVYKGSAPLREMFGFVNSLRQVTKGRGDFTMNFWRYQTFEGPELQVMVQEFADKLSKRKSYYN